MLTLIEYNFFPLLYFSLFRDATKKHLRLLKINKKANFKKTQKQNQKTTKIKFEIQ